VRRKPLALTVAADDKARASRFPSMIVIPLAEAILAAVPTAATMTIRAERAGVRVALRMRCEGIGDSPALEGLRRRLIELYGDAATLSWAETPEYCEATLEIDDEEPQSDHR
jgi:LytS/YehU family sensor histidine kinase